MKTRNNIQETVKGQVKNMFLRGSSVVFSLVLISLTLTAQNFRTQYLNNSIENEIDLLAHKQVPEFKNAEAAIEAIFAELGVQTSAEIFRIEAEMDEQLEVEAWMTDVTSFGSHTSLIAEESDDAITLEAWMISNANFSNQSVSIFAEAEPALEVEAWMISENFFNTTEELSARDRDLRIENWMLANKYFSNKIEFEKGNPEFNVRTTATRFRGF